MEKRRIGSLEVSIVGIGANNFGTDFFGHRCDEADVDRIIGTALDAGINFIDTAEEYSTTTRVGTGRSEQFIGAAIRARRDEVVIATKFGNEDASDARQRGAERIVSAVEGSLKRLGTDRIDLYQQHQPDPRTPIEESLEALDRLVRDGKVREIGCCNFSGAMIDEARAHSDEHGLARFVSAQNRYNLLEPPRQDDVLAGCRRHSMVLLPYYPLASGLLTGKYRAGHVPPGSRLASESPIAKRIKDPLLAAERLEKVALLERFARDRGHTLLELAFSWLASQPVVASVIAGVTRPDQVVANAAAAGWTLSSADFDDIERIVGWRPDPAPRATP